MASITLKDIPAALHREVKAQAKKHNRSLNREAIALLDQALASHRPVNVERMIEGERKLREKLRKLGVWATPEDIDRFKREGRE